MRNMVELNKRFSELSSGIRIFISGLEITSGILASVAIFVFLFGICTKNYSYQTSMEICYYAMLFSFVCLPVYLITTLIKMRNFENDYLKLIYFIRHFVISLSVGWLICCGILYFIQEDLYFLIPKNQTKLISGLKKEYKNAEEVKLKTEDDIMLHGFLFKADTKNKAPLIIFFNGSGGDVLSFAYIANEFSKRGYYSALINYRGFGLSEGKPYEKNFYNDAQFIYDYFCSRPDVDSENVYAIGGSMGTGIALNLATKRHLKALALFSPYDKIAGGTIHDSLPFLPTSVLLKNKFNAISFSHQVKIPVLCLIGEEDNIISPERSFKLAKNLGGKYYTKIIKDASHLSIYTDKNSWEYIFKFLGGQNVQ